MNFHSKSRANIFRLKDPEVDAAIDAVKAARGRDARMKASCHLQKTLVDKALILPWEQGDVTLAYWPHVKNVIRPLSIHPKYQRIWLDK
jgi:ABC-type oligopeptide transport system substrate-binding subunit